MNLFIKWWWFFTLICVSTIFVYKTGFFKEVWLKDASYLSLTTLVLFFSVSLICGLKTYLLSRAIGKSMTQARYDEFERSEEIGWFSSELCLSLGMLGTIVGFVFMLSGFENIDISKTHTIQALLSDLGKSMATALYTTLIGLVCGCLLKIQYFNYSLALQSVVPVKVKSEILNEN